MYWKGLQDQVAVRSPMELGGLKTEEYLAINPQGKMPALVLPDGTSLAESEVCDWPLPRSPVPHCPQCLCHLVCVTVSLVQALGGTPACLPLTQSVQQHILQYAYPSLALLRGQEWTCHGKHQE